MGQSFSNTGPRTRTKDWPFKTSTLWVPTGDMHARVSQVLAATLKHCALGHLKVSLFKKKCHKDLGLSRQGHNNCMSFQAGPTQPLFTCVTLLCPSFFVGDLSAWCLLWGRRG